MTSTALRWKSDGFLSPLWTTRGTRHGTSIGCWIRWSENRSDTESRRNNTREEDRRALHSFWCSSKPNNEWPTILQTPTNNLPKGPFTFTIVTTRFPFTSGPQNYSCGYIQSLKRRVVQLSIGQKRHSFLFYKDIVGLVRMWQILRHYL